MKPQENSEYFELDNEPVESPDLSDAIEAKKRTLQDLACHALLSGEKVVEHYLKARFHADAPLYDVTIVPPEESHGVILSTGARYAFYHQSSLKGTAATCPHFSTDGKARNLADFVLYDQSFAISHGFEGTGMGAHASKIIMDSMRHWREPILIDTVRTAHEQLLDADTGLKGSAGVLSVRISDDSLEVISVGDPRLFVFDKYGNLKFKTLPQIQKGIGPAFSNVEEVYNILTLEPGDYLIALSSTGRSNDDLPFIQSFVQSAREDIPHCYWASVIAGRLLRNQRELLEQFSARQRKRVQGMDVKDIAVICLQYKQKLPGTE